MAKHSTRHDFLDKNLDQIFNINTLLSNQKKDQRIKDILTTAQQIGRIELTAQ